MAVDVSLGISGNVLKRHAFPSAPAPAAGHPVRPSAVVTGGTATANPSGAPVAGHEAADLPPLEAAGAQELPGPSRSFISKTTEFLNQILEESRRRLKFNVHEATGRIWVQIIDTETHEVIKEIPPERYLDLVARIWELVGILVDEKA